MSNLNCWPLTPSAGSKRGYWRCPIWLQSARSITPYCSAQSVDSNDRVTPHSARSGNRASCASGAPVVGARIKRRHGPERPRYSLPPTRLSASPVQETGLAVLDQLTPGQLAQADIEHRRQEQAEQGDPDHAGEHGDAGRRAHLAAGAL